MKFSFRLFYGLLLTLGLLRALAYFWYAWLILPSPMEAFHLEAKMVLLAYRAQQGLSLYPEWRNYPHVSNFYGPVYFELVGRLGRFLGSDIPGLFRIGRALTFGSGLATSMILGIMIARRSGKLAGWTAGLLSLGTSPLLGFSVMVRPDLLAEFLAISGFFLAMSQNRGARIAGGVFLILAILTKQTTGLFLLTATFLWLIEGNWRRAASLLVGGLGVLAVVIGLISLLFEPHLFASLLGDAKTPWSIDFLISVLKRLCLTSPELLILPVIGIGLWLSKATGRREFRPIILTLVLLASSIVLSMKIGADLNYFLSLRVCEALVIGSLGQAWMLSRSGRQSAILAVTTLLACLATVPSLQTIISQDLISWRQSEMMSRPLGRELSSLYRGFFAMAGDPKFKLLTDSGLIDLYHGERADFGDPHLFRLQVETGQYDPSEIRDRINRQYYELIITTAELEKPSYDEYKFGFPISMVQSLRARYVRVGSQAGLFLYGRR